MLCEIPIDSRLGSEVRYRLDLQFERPAHDGYAHGEAASAAIEKIPTRIELVSIERRTLRFSITNGTALCQGRDRSWSE
jgi:hypothetical protein